MGQDAPRQDGAHGELAVGFANLPLGNKDLLEDLERAVQTTAEFFRHHAARVPDPCVIGLTVPSGSGVETIRLSVSLGAIDRLPPGRPADDSILLGTNHLEGEVSETVVMAAMSQLHTLWCSAIRLYLCIDETCSEDNGTSCNDDETLCNNDKTCFKLLKEVAQAQLRFAPIPELRVVKEGRKRHAVPRYEPVLPETLGFALYTDLRNRIHKVTDRRKVVAICSFDECDRLYVPTHGRKRCRAPHTKHSKR